jgi:alkylation response protein AidB-like acyl-CoA dehydrogenase
MNFELSKEEMDIKMAAREFAEGEIRDIAKEYDQAGRVSQKTLEERPASWDLWAGLLRRNTKEPV